MPQEFRRQGRQAPLTCTGSSDGDAPLMILISPHSRASGIFLEEFGTTKYWDAVGKALLARERNRITGAKRAAKAELHTHQLR